MAVLEEMKTKYGENYPIFLSDFGMDGATRAYLSRSVAEGLIKRFASGIYFFPKQTRFGTGTLSLSTVYRRKYICDADEVFGYYSGLSFQQQIGYTTQVPNIPEIVTNKEASARRVVSLDGKRQVILRMPRVAVTKENADILPLMDLITAEEVKALRQKREIIVSYIRNRKIKAVQIMEITGFYPARTAQKLIETGIIYEFA